MLAILGGLQPEKTHTHTERSPLSWATRDSLLNITTEETARSPLFLPRQSAGQPAGQGTGQECPGSYPESCPEGWGCPAGPSILRKKSSCNPLLSDKFRIQKKPRLVPGVCPGLSTTLCEAGLLVQKGACHWAYDRNRFVFYFCWYGSN